MKIIDWLRGRKRRGAERGEDSRPVKCAANPGTGIHGRVAFANSEGSWTESFHLIHLAARVLRERGHEVVEHDTWLDLRASGFVLQPLIVELRPLEQGGVQTLTTIDVRHANLVPEGLFEYQHSTGDTVEDSLGKGIAAWEEIDLAVLLDALREKPKTCTTMEMNFPARDGAPARARRAVLGPVANYVEHPPASGGMDCNAGRGASQGDGEPDHSFCTCCFLTRNYEVFRPQIEGDGYFGIRFSMLSIHAR